MEGGAPVLRTVGLTKRFGQRLALDDLTLEITPGRVHGFLGPNGAGKTTAISLILGLLSPTRGHVELFGMDCRTHLTRALRRVGAVLENVAFYPHLSGRENLRICADISRVEDRSAIDRSLELVGMAARAKDKVRGYSMGMRQRLAVAAALLHDPELLILDEPTNGLDPAGIREFRDLIRRLAAGGKTVFVSSHLLAEVEQMCDEVAIINRGRLVMQGAVADITRRERRLRLVTTDNDRAADVLRALPWVTNVASEDAALLVDAPKERGAEISRALALAEVYLWEMAPAETSLEDVFLELTRGSVP
jgi:ABC-2 type transport system ATP-binding protein